MNTSEHPRSLSRRISSKKHNRTSNPENVKPYTLNEKPSLQPEDPSVAATSPNSNNYRACSLLAVMYELRKCVPLCFSLSLSPSLSLSLSLSRSRSLHLSGATLFDVVLCFFLAISLSLSPSLPLVVKHYDFKPAIKTQETGPSCQESFVIASILNQKSGIHPEAAAIPNQAANRHLEFRLGCPDFFKTCGCTAAVSFSGTSGPA